MIMLYLSIVVVKRILESAFTMPPAGIIEEVEP